MKINIYGVGRSGTKAIQLYLSYLVANEKKKVWINYEPYFWTDRLLSNKSYEGIYHHINTPLNTNSITDLSKKHQNYLKKLSNKKCDIISKFIRGNGRASEINQIMKPDYTIVVVRNLYQVLESIAIRQWDLLGTNLYYSFDIRDDWKKLKKEVRENKYLKNNEINYFIKQIKNKIDKNAFYWYIMNLNILNSELNNVFFVNFDTLNKLENISNRIGLTTGSKIITDKFFTGSLIHTNNVLTSKNAKISKMKRRLNILFLNSPILRKLNLVLSHSIGSMANINTKKNKRVNKRNKNHHEIELDIKKNELYDHFNNQIMEKLNEKILSQEEN